MIKNFKKVIPLVAFCAIMSLSSCNRGVGCPSDFSLTDVVVEKTVQVVKAIPSAICDWLCKDDCPLD